MSSGMRYLYGSFNKESKLAFGRPAHLPFLKFDNELQIMFRLLPFFEPFLRLPVRIQTSANKTGAGFADMTLGARIPVVKEDAIIGMPALTFFSSVAIPTGTKFHNQRDMAIEDITSSGNFVINAGVVLEKEFAGVNYGLGYTFSAPIDYFAGGPLRPGAEHAPMCSVGYSLDDWGYLSGAMVASFQERATVNHQPAANTDRRKVTLSAGYTLPLHSHIKISGQLGTDVAIPYIGKNFDSEIFFRLGMRLGVF